MELPTEGLQLNSNHSTQKNNLCVLKNSKICIKKKREIGGNLEMSQPCGPLMASYHMLAVILFMNAVIGIQLSVLY